MRLRDYIIRRLLLLPLVLLGVMLVIFVIMQGFTPAQRAVAFIQTKEEMLYIGDIIKRYHLDEPFHIQFFYWFNNVLHGNLGYSVSANMPVSQAILTYFPATVELVFLAIPLMLLLGMMFGILAAVYKDSVIDHVVRFFSISAWSLPTFWSAIILLAIFYGVFGIFPPGRLSVQTVLSLSQTRFISYTGMYIIDGLLNGRPDVSWDALNHVILPSLNLAILSSALPMRIMRSSMLEALSKEYITAARAKGLSKWAAIWKHAVKNALIPMITVAGTMVANLITGVVITETVFAYPGLGKFAAGAAMSLDMPGILGFALFAATIYAITNLIVDVLYCLIDPRIKY
ncbi:MAG: ABC transporter permease [archaeon YNP-LCB-003-016]|uniref:ABC transporter permease n=1 Tax=Candidatus Culexarchaeum yellowstonense TaxID=2928963 RepID=UPI0026F285E9|nr:ABC transporter permease [Candidatus Culexarchaeum yellowstonense]MCR6692383.1 ABC transporter permease [Candidatus Culexarchaeum yellowstonense]